MPRHGPIVLDLEISVPAPSADMNLEEVCDSWEQSHEHYFFQLQWPKWTSGFGVRAHPLFASPREVFLLVAWHTGALDPLFATKTVMVRRAETVERMPPPEWRSLQIVNLDDVPPAELLATEWAWSDYFLYKIGITPRITKIFVAEGGTFVEACKRYEDVYREEIENIAKWVEQGLADPGLWQVPEVSVDLPRLEAEIFGRISGIAPKRRIPEGHVKCFSPRPGLYEEVGEALVQRAHVAEAILDGLHTSLQAALFDQAERFYRVFERLFEGGPAIESAIPAHTLADMRKTIEAAPLRADRPWVLSNYRQQLGEGFYAWLVLKLAQQLRSPKDP